MNEFAWAARLRGPGQDAAERLTGRRLRQSWPGWTATRRYSVAGNVAWIALPRADQLPTLESILADLNLGGVRSAARPAPLLGQHSGEPFFYRRVKNTLDPDGRFDDL